VVILPPVIPADVPPSADTQLLEGLADRFLSFAIETERAATPAAYASAPLIVDSVDRSATLIGPDLIDGARAAAIIAAAASPEFQAGIDTIGRPMGRDAFIARIKAEPGFVLTIPGVDAARARAGGVTGSAFGRIEASAAVLHQASYDIQRQRWTQTPVDKQARLSAIAARWQQPWPLQGLKVAEAPAAATPASVGDGLLSAAALLAVRDDAGAVATLNRGSGRSCAVRAYLNLRQCIAAGRFPYEQTFCLAVHSYREQNGCLKDATD
jgi:hypothetical protein